MYHSERANERTNHITVFPTVLFIYRYCFCGVEYQPHYCCGGGGEIPPTLLQRKQYPHLCYLVVCFNLTCNYCCSKWTRSRTMMKHYFKPSHPSCFAQTRTISLRTPIQPPPHTKHLRKFYSHSLCMLSGDSRTNDVMLSYSVDFLLFVLSSTR